MEETEAMIHNRRDMVTRNDLEIELNKFKQFAFAQNMVQVSVGMVLAGAFGKVVSAISNNLIMPLVQYVLSTTGEGWRAAVWKPIPSLTFEIGAFVGSFVDFLLTALVLYVLYVKIAKPILYPEANAEPAPKVPVCPPSV
jgi:large conductance mechanosensitive channel